MRRIVQIAIDPETPDNGTVVYALCEDGTLWFKIGEQDWDLLEGIPDKEPRYQTP
jgi:hypothetical protein